MASSHPLIHSMFSNSRAGIPCSAFWTLDSELSLINPHVSPINPYLHMWLLNDTHISINQHTVRFPSLASAPIDIVDPHV
jgi:hypothetical protein